MDTREEVLRAADLFLDGDVPIEAAPAKHAVAQGMFLYVYEPGGNRVEVTTGTHFIYDPDYEPIVWTDKRALDDDGEPLVVYEPSGPVPRDDEAAEILAEREGALMWPERFGEQEVRDLEISLGPYFASGRLQQSPEPKGAQLFVPDWWQLWEPPDGKFPILDYTIASLDGAFTADKINDPSALTVWGVFWHPEVMGERVMLLNAWEQHLKLHGVDTERLPSEMLLPGDSPEVIAMKNKVHGQRISNKWGLVEKVRQTCLHYKVEALVIENAASGSTVRRATAALCRRSLHHLSGKAQRRQG